MSAQLNGRHAIATSTSATEKGRTTAEKVDKTLTEELILGICAPIGSLKEDVISSIIDILKVTYGYEEVKTYKLSNYIQTQTKEPLPSSKDGETPAFTKLMNKIKEGNQLRAKHSFSCLAELVIQDIYLHRVKPLENPDQIENLNSRRVCYIIDSLKNTEELNVFRKVYSDIFYSFGVFSSKEERKKNLQNKGLAEPEIKKLIDTDDFENNQEGQNVRNTFVDSDFFVRVSRGNKKKEDYLKDINKKIERYLHLIFESEIITPKPEEIAMYEAKSSAGNSACLSRQVGACITNKKGEIISRGWNDVPKFGGNLYNESSSVDHRCIYLDRPLCKNDSTKDDMTNDIILKVLSDELLKNFFKNEQSEQTKKLYEILRSSSKIKDLIEFSRAVHAEMHAIISGSQLAGNKMINGKLYCTTYPCHNCARHIIVAGIKEVFYIEPYSKSLCLDLHSDAMTDNEEESSNKVKLLVYDGVAPRRFLEFFTMSRGRKDKNGEKVKIDFRKIVPKRRISIQALPTLERQAIHSLEENGLKNQ